MKKRCVGIGFGVSAALAWSVVWPDPAWAFSLGSSVTASNNLKYIDEKGEAVLIPFEESGPFEVRAGVELQQFGGIWDIDFGDNALLFTLNSKFGNVVTGDDVYRFLSPALDQMGQPPTISLLSFTDFSPDNRPFARFRRADVLEVVFPLGFAPKGLLPPQTGSTPQIRTELPVKPYAVPTPAFLSGLLGMVLAVLRRHGICDDDS